MVKLAGLKHAQPPPHSIRSAQPKLAGLRLHFLPTPRPRVLSCAVKPSRRATRAVRLLPTRVASDSRRHGGAAFSVVVVVRGDRRSEITGRLRRRLRGIALKVCAICLPPSPMRLRWSLERFLIAPPRR